MGISWDTPADSNRGSSLQNPAINTVKDDCAHRPGKMYFRNAKIFGEFVGAQWVDVGIDPYQFVNSKILFLDRDEKA